ncbi:sodium:proton antiporter [Helicobacter didelphidarum]|uniref:Sodium:proton antiporter n=1 Tax=Helicobacter didelphidarum TaxID=2040648 RepID=A0A3D8IH36_9HELI|nr:Na+/H+ antiporter NhaC family protein [Helicobacter didelphidarum]RDU64226.1 sodium:proton antiporter [Helicobacter didelphidarum]
MDILSNAVVVSVCVMAILCILRLNVLLSIIIAALCAGLLSPNLVQNYQNNQELQTKEQDSKNNTNRDNSHTQQDVKQQNILETITITGQILIDGMAGNLNVALSYILLGAIAIAIAQSNLMMFLVNAIAKSISNKKILLILSIGFFACFSQNLIPVHIAFIPILIPPLLGLMNKLKIDRRAVACALTFGLQAPYISFGVGYGLIFYTVMKDQINANGMSVDIQDIAGVMWIGGVAMIFGLLFAVLILYRKPRTYQNCETTNLETKKISFRRREMAVLLGICIAFAGQLLTNSLPLGAFAGLISMILLGGIKWNEIDSVMEGGLKMMAFIAFVMLVAAGYGEILRQGGEVQNLVLSLTNMAHTKFISASLMLAVGLLVTIGIGTSFGTVPIIATIYVPLSVTLGFSLEATILLIGIAGALGDAGSPASDSTLGPTSGLNADGQHDHIRDTCIPTFLVFNTSLLIVGLIGAMVL